MAIDSSSPSSADNAAAIGWRLEHSYAELPAVLHEAVGPMAVMCRPPDDFDDPAPWWPDLPDVYGGRDRTAGGTWCATRA